MTSSGKTYTTRAITQLAVSEIFNQIRETPEREFLLRFSALEIYNEVVRDLLNVDSVGLRLLDDPERGTVVEKLREVVVTSIEHLAQLLLECEAQRQVAETFLNDASSRSHQIVRLTVESCPRIMDREASGDDDSREMGAAPAGGEALRACLNLVDLAGSERAILSQTEGSRLKEGGHINRSLLALGTVIRKLGSAKGGRSHIPYRDSKLTRILQHSLGGNARTAIICTVCPGAQHIEQTRNTLAFAVRATEVSNSVKVNTVGPGETLMQQLQEEVARLEGDLRRLPSRREHHRNLVRIRELEAECEALRAERDEAQEHAQRLASLLAEAQAQQQGGAAPAPVAEALEREGQKGQKRGSSAKGGQLLSKKGAIFPEWATSAFSGSSSQGEGGGKSSTKGKKLSRESATWTHGADQSTSSDATFDSWLMGHGSRERRRASSPLSKARKSAEGSKRERKEHKRAAREKSLELLEALGEERNRLESGVPSENKGKESSAEEREQQANEPWDQGCFKKGIRVRRGRDIDASEEEDGDEELALAALEQRITCMQISFEKLCSTPVAKLRGQAQGQRAVSPTKKSPVKKDPPDCAGSLAQKAGQGVGAAAGSEGPGGAVMVREATGMEESGGRSGRRAGTPAACNAHASEEATRHPRLSGADCAGPSSLAASPEAGSPVRRLLRSESPVGPTAPLETRRHSSPGVALAQSDVPLAAAASASLDVRRMQALFKEAAEENIKSIRSYVTELKERVAKLHYQKQLLLCQVLELEGKEGDAESQGGGLEAEADSGDEEDGHGGDRAEKERAEAGQGGEPHQRLGAQELRASQSLASQQMGPSSSSADEAAAAAAAALAVPGSLAPPGGTDPSGPVPEPRFAGEVACIVELWDLCQVSLIHRTEVYLLMRGLATDRAYLALERRRLQWLQEQWYADAEAAPNAQVDREEALRREREQLAYRMKLRLTPRQREELYQCWGVPQGSKRRKERLVARLWADPHNMREVEASARIVGHLVGFTDRPGMPPEILELRFSPPSWQSGWLTRRGSLVF